MSGQAEPKASSKPPIRVLSCTWQQTKYRNPQPLYLTPPPASTPLLGLPNEILAQILKNVLDLCRYSFAWYSNEKPGISPKAKFRPITALATIHPRLTPMAEYHNFRRLTLFSSYDLEFLRQCLDRDPRRTVYLRGLTRHNLTVKFCENGFTSQKALREFFEVVRGWDGTGLLHPLGLEISLKLRIAGNQAFEGGLPRDWEEQIYAACGAPYERGNDGLLHSKKDEITTGCKNLRMNKVILYTMSKALMEGCRWDWEARTRRGAPYYHYSGGDDDWCGRVVHQCEWVQKLRVYTERARVWQVYMHYCCDDSDTCEEQWEVGRLREQWFMM
ncbi:hypothetical protein BJ508DRAFT_306920 [Ascobolus immersus RN42]|uniref:Uncharacterized protein n=1 Tax=Ascobolus immersus RN42 TaxID=1160509 RepID=A0A3N4I4C6_ASCIM|nr:hypothetical protein BJ508DRAFT_306920 [Ascobolus immersus RN42]